MGKYKVTSNIRVSPDGESLQLYHNSLVGVYSKLIFKVPLPRTSTLEELHGIKEPTENLI
jgi:hypothetical protein